MSHFHDPFRPSSARDEDGAQPRTVAEPDPVAEVPDGTTKEVLEWVGDDKDRASLALQKEQDHDDPRKGVVEKLTKLLEKDDDEDE